jgi:hypothetical protein
VCGPRRALLLAAALLILTAGCTPQDEQSRIEWRGTQFLQAVLTTVAQVVVVLVAIRMYRTRTRQKLEAESKSETAPESFTETGGGADEYMRASWPFVRLTVARDRLEFSLLGRKYNLTPADVAAIERYRLLPLLGEGILLVFNRAGRTHFLRFFAFSGADNLLLRIRNVGFVPQAQDDGKRPWTLPLRWWVLALPIVGWVAMSIDFARSHGPAPTSFGLLVATCLLSWTLLWSKPLQRMVLRPGRSISEARLGILLVALLTGIALVIALTLMCLWWLRPDIMSPPPIH